MKADRITFADSFADGLTELSLPVDADRIPAPFKLVPVADLARVETVPPAYWWEGYLPAGVLTLLGAHGGTGKSFIALMLAVCIALDMPMFGIPTRRGRVLYFSGEDSGDVVRHRLKWICAALGIDPATLEGWLHILDATAGEPVLFHEVAEGGRRRGATTPSYEALKEYIRANGIDVLMIDNASDALDASENDRARVRAFVRSLVQLVQAQAGAVLLLAHVDKGTSRGDRGGTEAYSGSTAWHNSARSRLYLSRDRDGTLLLEHHKSTFGAMREPLRLVWPKGGIPQVDAPASGFVQAIDDRNIMRAVLRLIHEFTERGEYVSSATTSRTHAGKLLIGQPGYPSRLSERELFDQLRTAERRGLIVRDTFRGADRKPRERWNLTPAGMTEAGIAATAATAATTDVTAPGAVAQEPAATAATSPGGYGGKERAQLGVQA